MDHLEAAQHFCEPVRAWFVRSFPAGPTPAQGRSWPIVGAGSNLLLTSPTGTGKTLAAFLAIIDRLFREHLAGTLRPGLQCVYVSPLKSLGYDIEKNLTGPLVGICQQVGSATSPITVATRTGDSTPAERRRVRDQPPQILITTPESLALMMSQSGWRAAWKGVRFVIVDEIHSLVATKRGADLVTTIERLAYHADLDPVRIGLSATCQPTALVAEHLVGPTRRCAVVAAEVPGHGEKLTIDVGSLFGADEVPHPRTVYRRLIKRLRDEIQHRRTTIVFANTRSLTERITHDLRAEFGAQAALIAAHHGSLTASRRKSIETDLKQGRLRAVVSSTSLELGIDIGHVDLAILVGLPGSTSRCLQRIGRAGHDLTRPSRGLILATNPAEVVGAVVTADSARALELEALRAPANPLDVACQQLVGMACEGEWSADAAFGLLRKTGPFATLTRPDFDRCLDALAGELPAPAGAMDSDTGSSLRWSSPRIWKRNGLFGLGSGRVMRWLWSNIGTILSEESAQVEVDGSVLGTLDLSYAERLQPGDRFLLDGRCLEFRRLDGSTAVAATVEGESLSPRWSSDRQGLSSELSRKLVVLRHELAQRLNHNPSGAKDWLVSAFNIQEQVAEHLLRLVGMQDQLSVVPAADEILVEITHDLHDDGVRYTFHLPLGRSAVEAFGRVVSTRIGRRFGRDLVLDVADLGCSIAVPTAEELTTEEIQLLCSPDHLGDDLVEALDRGELEGRRFRAVAATGLMVLKRPEGKKVRVGGLGWVSQKLYPLLRAACPMHPLLAETRRELLEDLFDLRAIGDYLDSRPTILVRHLEAPSPFAVTWITVQGNEVVAFEAPEDALARLHKRLVAT